MSKIVILEDDFTLLDLYRDVMQRADFEVFGAPGLQDALDYFENDTANLIIADLRLGATTAEETIEAVVQICQTHNIPAVLISAQMMIYEDECREAGFEHLLMKPFQNSVLVETAQHAIDASA